MTAHRTNVDEQPESEFQRQAKDLLRRRLAASTNGDRQALERELADLLRTHRERSAWDAAAAAEAVQRPVDVSRDTSRDRSCHIDTQAASGAVDRKTAAAGPEAE